MAEKASLPSDTVSLPPTYAPSEAFTESPPPAYRKPGMAAIRIAKLVCFTLIAMTFIVGFFVITHKYIQNQNCDCHKVEQQDLVRAAALSGSSVFDLNNNKIEDDIAVKNVEAAMDDTPTTDEEDSDESFPEEQIVGEPIILDEPNTFLEEKLEQIKNDLRLPKDLLLGNPKMAGKDVQCKVEKKQQKIAEGIISQAIIVTCDDEDEEEENNPEELDNGNNIEAPFPMAMPKPPLSLLNSIMKILSSRPPMENRIPLNIPRREPKFMPFDNMPRHSMPMLPPFKFLPQTFERPTFVPLRQFPVPRPFENIDEQQPLRPIIMQRPPPEVVYGRTPKMLPPVRIISRPSNDVNGLPPPFLPNNLPIKIIRIPPPQNIMDERENQNQPEEENEEFPRPPVNPFLKFLAPRILRFRPFPQSENIPENSQGFPNDFSPESPHIPHPMPEASGRALPSPVALPDVKIVRLPFMPQGRVIPEANLMTHMEVRAPETDVQDQQIDEPEPLRTFQNEANTLTGGDVEFGPPKVHTVINETPQPMAEAPQPSDIVEPESNEPIMRFQPRFFALPPPPSFASEGRISEQAELNPDAEIVPINEPQRQIHRVIIN